MEEYKILTGVSKFIGNQPVTFSKKTYNPNIDYFLTHKLDGKRHLLFITKNASFLVTSKMEFTPVKLPKVAHKLYPNTIFDMELYNKKYFIFDILYIDGVDLRSKKLSERLPYLGEAVAKIKSKKIIIKPYLSPYSVTVLDNFKTLKSLYAKEMKTGEVDGVIFVPDARYTATVLKWKPNWLLSIDFKIKKLDNSKFALLTQNDSVYSPHKRPEVGVTKVSLEDYTRYPEGAIVEFIFKGGKFVPLRARPDKIKSNYITVINSNFQEILYPTNVEKILRGK